MKDEGELYTKIVGVTFEGRQEVLQNLKAGDKLILKREPDNEFDPNAVAVLTTKEEQAGYLNKQLAMDFAEGMDKGLLYGAEVLEVTRDSSVKDSSFGCNIKIIRVWAKDDNEDKEKRLRNLADNAFTIAGNIYAQRYNEDNRLFSADRNEREQAARDIYQVAEAIFYQGIALEFLDWSNKALSSVPNSGKDNAPCAPASQATPPAEPSTNKILVDGHVRGPTLHDLAHQRLTQS